MNSGFRGAVDPNMISFHAPDGNEVSKSSIFHNLMSAFPFLCMKIKLNEFATKEFNIMTNDESTKGYSLTSIEKKFADQNVKIGMKDINAVEVAKLQGHVSNKLAKSDDEILTQRDILLVMREALYDHGLSVRNEREILKNQL